MNYLLTAQLQTLPMPDFVDAVKEGLRSKMPEGSQVDLSCLTQLDGGIEARLWLRFPDDTKSEIVQQFVGQARQAIHTNFDPHCTVNSKCYDDEEKEAAPTKTVQE